jgi:hypothetical protein
MLEEAHRQAAEDIERSIADLGDPLAKPSNNRSAIECYWGAAFHCITFGCQRKHRRHKENHSKLESYLRDLNEPAIATNWRTLEDRVRAVGMGISIFPKTWTQLGANAWRFTYGHSVDGRADADPARRSC